MQISSATNPWASTMRTNRADANREVKSASAPTRSEAVEQFRAYMNKSPQQLLQEEWLKRHGITPEEFAALPADKKQAIVDQMRTELEAQMKQQSAEGKKGQIADLLV